MSLSQINTFFNSFREYCSLLEIFGGPLTLVFAMNMLAKDLRFSWGWRACGLMPVNHLLNVVCVCRVADILTEDAVYPHPCGHRYIPDYQLLKFFVENVLCTRYRAVDGEWAFQRLWLYPLWTGFWIEAQDQCEINLKISSSDQTMSLCNHWMRSVLVCAAIRLALEGDRMWRYYYALVQLPCLLQHSRDIAVARYPLEHYCAIFFTCLCEFL